jgi:hypothetical protein
MATAAAPRVCASPWRSALRAVHSAVHAGGGGGGRRPGAHVEHLPQLQRLPWLWHRTVRRPPVAAHGRLTAGPGSTRMNAAACLCFKLQRCCRHLPWLSTRRSRGDCSWLDVKLRPLDCCWLTTQVQEQSQRMTLVRFERHQAAYWCLCRCSLCRGAGVVGWEGKWSHKELCPSCLGKRFVSCPHCGEGRAMPQTMYLQLQLNICTRFQCRHCGLVQPAAALLWYRPVQQPPAANQQHRSAACAAGGHFHRPTFVHARCRGRADALASMDDDGSSDAFLAVRRPPLEGKGSGSAHPAPLPARPRRHACIGATAATSDRNRGFGVCCQCILVAIPA